MLPDGFANPRDIVVQYQITTDVWCHSTAPDWFRLAVQVRRSHYARIAYSARGADPPLSVALAFRAGVLRWFACCITDQRDLIRRLQQTLLHNLGFGSSREEEDYHA